MTMSIDDVVITCCSTDCGISFAVPKWWHTGKRENHSWFYCPNGHHQHFPAETDLEKARRERDIARQQVARAEDERNQAEREAKRLRKRAAAGVCPCCNRTFTNMRRHMATKHPEISVILPMKAKP